MRAFVVNLSPTLLGLFILAVFLILGSGLLYGFAYVIKGIEPILLGLISLSMLLFVLCVLPCSLAKKLRSRMGVYATLLSTICGGCTWLISFMYILLYLKAWVFLFIWLFQISAPLAVILLLSDAHYVPAVFLAIAFAATYGMRFYAAWLARSSDGGPGAAGSTPAEGDIFDAEVVEK